jgi:hypothetical protein
VRVTCTPLAGGPVGRAWSRTSLSPGSKPRGNSCCCDQRLRHRDVRAGRPGR